MRRRYRTHPLHRLRTYRKPRLPHHHLPPAFSDQDKADPHSPFVGGQSITKHEHKLAEDLHDWILGGQDGIVNVLGSVLGIAVVTTNRTIIIAGGLAGLFAEAISIAAVAYTSVKASRSYYESEREQQRKLIEENPYLQREVLIDTYERKGLPRHEAKHIVEELTRNKAVWLEMLMEEHLHLPAPDGDQPMRSAAIVGAAATLGSLIALAPFFFLSGITAILTAIVSSTVILFGAGAFAAKLTIGDWRKRGLEIAAIGMTAAIMGVLIGWAFTSGVLSVGQGNT